MPNDAYLQGRTMSSIEEPFQGVDACYAGIRLDGIEMKDASYKHCTFANISFKEVRIIGGSFLNCVFIGCYFRRADLQNTSFVGCRFIDCLFPHIGMQSCELRYLLFQGCCFPYSEVEHSLPTQPNTLEELARNLSIEAQKLGLGQDARRYRMCALQARERHLLAAAKSESKWYKEHYGQTAQQIGACVQFVLSRANGLLWGYGEKPLTLIRNYLISGLFIFPLSLYWAKDGLSNSSGGAVGIAEVLSLSIDSLLPSAFASATIPIGSVARMIVGLENIWGIIVAALLASQVFRWSLQR